MPRSRVNLRIPAATAVFSLALILVPLPASTEVPARVKIGDFSGGELDPWREKVFHGQTEWRLHSDDKGTVLAARTHGSASGLYREITVDLSRTPYLNWSWRVDNVYQELDEKSKSGDDYPARVYVVVSGGLKFWETRALSYVWSSSLPEGSRWANAFTDKARMIAVQSGNRHTGEWRHYKRNVRADLAEVFKEDIREIHGVALMSDSDNAGQTARAFYGDLYFSAD